MTIPQNKDVRQLVWHLYLHVRYCRGAVSSSVITQRAIKQLFRPRPFLISFLLHSWQAIRSYRPNLEIRDPIWGDDWSHSLHQMVSKQRFSRVFLRFGRISVHSPQSISLSSLLADRRDWHDTRSKLPLARNLDMNWWHCHTGLKLFWSWLHGPRTRVSSLI